MLPSLQPEFWLRGPVNGISPFLQPVAHALLQAANEVQIALRDFSGDKLWSKPAGSASVAFHLQHLAGVLDRLFTYANQQQLNVSQLTCLKAEGVENKNLDLKFLLSSFLQQIDISIAKLKDIPDHMVLEPRSVGRKKMPSNVLGLLFHAAEHTQRHTGQLLVTARVLSGRP